MYRIFRPGLFHMCERTIKIENIPLYLPIEEIQQAFNSDSYEQIHLPRDNIDQHIGIAFLTFKSTTSREQFCRNLNYPNKFVFLTRDIYEGPLIIKSMEFPDLHQSSKEKLRFTGNTPEDEIAVKVGEMYINVQNKCELELKQKLEEIKQMEKNKDYQELAELQNQHREKQKDLEKVKEETEHLKRKISEQERKIQTKYVKK